jgi:ABC-type xylose transport system permease subunit
VRRTATGPRIWPDVLIVGIQVAVLVPVVFAMTLARRLAGFFTRDVDFSGRRDVWFMLVMICAAVIGTVFVVQAVRGRLWFVLVQIVLGIVVLTVAISLRPLRQI